MKKFFTNPWVLVALTMIVTLKLHGMIAGALVKVPFIGVWLVREM